jgi:hypothetical protein
MMEPRHPSREEKKMNMAPGNDSGYAVRGMPAAISGWAFDTMQ